MASRARVKLGRATRPRVRAKVARALAAEAVVQAQRAGRAGVGDDSRAVLLEQQAHVAHQVRLVQQRGDPPLTLARDAARGGVVGAKRAHGGGQVGKTRRHAPHVHLASKPVSFGDSYSLTHLLADSRKTAPGGATAARTRAGSASAPRAPSIQA